MKEKSQANTSKNVIKGAYMQLADARNTYNLALYKTEMRKYEITTEYDEETETLDWIARKNDITVYASCPLTLFALVVIADEYGEKWRDVPTGDVFNRILSKD